MKRAFSLVTIVAASFAAFAAPESYTLDPAHTVPYFSIQHFGMSTVQGHFERATGKVTIDRVAKSGSIEVKVPTATVSTGDTKRADGQRSRDEHLRAADFFNSAEYPEMLFKSTKLSFAGDKLASVEGNLTLVGVTRPVRLTVTHFNCGQNPFTKQEMCGADLVGTIKRTDFGMKYAVPAVGDEVKLMIAVEGYRD